MLPVIAWLAGSLAIGVAIFSLYLTITLYWQGPFRDLWEFVDDIEQQFQGQWPMHYLLEAYGGAHRIFLPKLIFFADYYWLGGRNHLTIITSLLCQLAYLGVIIIHLREQASFSNSERIITAACFALALFSTTQVNNFLYAMDVQWYMSNIFGLASLGILASQPRLPSQWFGVLLFGIAAALCNFTGLMALPVAALVLLLSRSPMPLRWPLIFAIAALCLLYVAHEKNHQQIVFSSLKQSDNWLTSAYIVIDTLSKMAPYLLRYLSSPLSRDWPVTGSALSVVGLGILGYYWIALFRSDSLSRWQRLCLYIATYIAASAVFTAFGRIIYPNSATAERYQTLVLPWLPALFGLTWPDWQRWRHATALLLLWLIVFGCYLLPTQLVSARDMALLSHRVNLAHTAARAGVLDPPYISSTLSHPLIKNGINSVKDNDNFLRSHQLGYFRQQPHFPLDSQPLVSTALPACEGYANIKLDATSTSWLIDGQLLADNKPARDIVLLQSGTVIGLGTLLRPANFLLPLDWQLAADSHFRAFARPDRLQTHLAVTLLGIRNQQAVCALPLPAIH